MREKNSSKIILLFGLMLLLALPIASAFANTFLEDKTMKLLKGVAGQYCVYLQNTGDGDIKQVIKVFEGKEYIRNLDEVSSEFDVPVGTVSDNLPVCMKVKLPRNATKGEKYMVSYGVANVESENKEGMVSFAPVQIREKFYLTEKLDEKERNHDMYIALSAGAVALFAIATGLYYRRRKKLKHENS